MPENCRKCAGNAAKWLARPKNGLLITPLRPKQYLKSFYCHFLFGYRLGRHVSYYRILVVGSDSDRYFNLLCFGLFRLSTHLRLRVNAFTLGFLTLLRFNEIRLTLDGKTDFSREKCSFIALMF